jgi:hypothetical protein
LFSVNATGGGTTAFAAIAVLASIISFIAFITLIAFMTLGSNGGRILFADPSLPPNLPAGHADQPRFGPADGDSGGPDRTSVSAAATVLEDSFDRPDSPTVGPGWVEIEQTGATVSIAANQLFFDDASDAVNRPLVRRPFTQAVTGTLQWDFDLNWARTGNEGTYRFLMQLGDGAVMSDGSQNEGAGVNLVWTNIDGTDESLGYRQGTVDTALTVVSGPAHISVVADLAVRTYSVSVGGAPVGAGIPFDANVASLNLVRFFADNLNEENFSGRSIDSLKLISPEAPPPVNAPPLAQDQSVSTGADTPRPVTLTAADPVECELVFGVVSPPVNGSLGVLTGQPCVPGSPNSDSATVVYTPNAGFTGSDAFIWQATDGLEISPEISNEATVSITIAETATLLSDTFDRADSPEAGAGWVEIEQLGATVSIANNQLLFDDTSDVALRPLVRRPFTQASTGTLQWDFDFNWAVTGNEGTYRFLMQLGDSAAMSDVSQNEGAGVNLVWTSINGAHQSLGYIKAGINTALAVISGPNHISVVADLAAQTYAVSVDGALVGAGIPFDANGPVNQVRFLADNLNELNFSGRTIDNLNIFAGASGSTGADTPRPVAQDDWVNTARDVPFDLVLVFTGPDGPGPYTYSIVTPPVHGTITGAGANRTYTPRPGFTGSDSFTWRVNDSQTDSNAATLTVNVSGENIAPVARNDTYAAFPGTPLTVGLLNGVLANDNDANGDLLTAVSITLPPAASGSLTLNGDGSFTFTPDVGFSGPVRFTYVADDGPLISNTAVVTINVAVEFETLNRQPANGQTNVSVNPTLEIDCSVPDTTSAQYQIATDPAFPTVVYDSGENINDICSHLAFADLNPLTDYFWRGRIKNARGVWSPYSPPTGFTTIDANPAFNYVFQDGHDGYRGARDADIRGSALDPAQVIRQWNQGAQDVLRTGRKMPSQPTDEIFRSLLQFDIDGRLTDPNAVINAYVELTGWHHTDSNHLFHAYNSMYRLNKPWGEGSNILGKIESPGDVSWTYSSLPEEWAIPGAGAASDTDPDADRPETALVQMVATNQEGYKSFWSSKDLVDAVKEWISNPASNYGVLIKAVDESSPQTLHQASRENPDINFRPKLVVLSTESLRTPSNLAPVARDQSASTTLNTPGSITLTATDTQQCELTFSIVAGPVHGSLSALAGQPCAAGGLNSDSVTLEYTPDAGFTGSDTFSFRANDTFLDSNIAPVTVTVTGEGTAAILLSDTFDRPDNPVVGAGWTEVEQPLLGATVSVASNRLVFGNASNRALRPLVSRGFDPVGTGTLRWDFDFDWVRTAFDAGYEVWMQLGDSAGMADPPSSIGTQFTGVGVDLRWGNFAGSGHQSLVARQNGGGASVTPLAVISGPAHLSVSVDLDLEPPKYSVTIATDTGGTVTVNGLAFDDARTVSKLDTVRFFTNNLDEASFSGRAFDNVTIAID